MKPGTGIAAVCGREIRRMRGRVIYPLMTVVLPLVSFFLFSAMFIKGIPRDLPVAVLDRDNSSLSRNLVRMIDALPGIRISRRAIDLREGKEFMARGETFALVVIPRNFQRDVRRGFAPKVVNYYNNQYLLIGGTIQKEIYSAIRTMSAGANVQTRMKKGEPYRRALVNIQPVLLQAHILFNPYTNYLYYLVSGLLPTMLHMFVLLSAIYCIGIELKQGTAGEWIELAGNSHIRAVVGKLLPYFIIFNIIGLFMHTLLFKFLGMPFRGSQPVVMISTVMLIWAYQSVALVFVAVMANLRLSLMGASFYASTAYTFIGMTFPIMAFPLPARVWAELLPLTHYMRIFINQAIMGGSPRFVIPSIFALAAFIISPFILGPRFRMITADEHYWGGA